MNDAEFLSQIAQLVEVSFPDPVAATRLTAIAERIEWRPIETAPRVDGVPLLLLQSGRRFLGEYDDSAGQWQGIHAFDGIETEKYLQEWPGRLYGVTHWQPLPQPPEQP